MGIGEAWGVWVGLLSALWLLVMVLLGLAVGAFRVGQWAKDSVLRHQSRRDVTGVAQQDAGVRGEHGPSPSVINEPAPGEIEVEGWDSVGSEIDAVKWASRETRAMWQGMATEEADRVFGLITAAWPAVLNEAGRNRVLGLFVEHAEPIALTRVGLVLSILPTWMAERVILHGYDRNLSRAIFDVTGVRVRVLIWGPESHPIVVPADPPAPFTHENAPAIMRVMWPRVEERYCNIAFGRRLPLLFEGHPQAVEWGVITVDGGRPASLIGSSKYVSEAVEQAVREVTGFDLQVVYVAPVSEPPSVAAAIS